MEINRYFPAYKTNFIEVQVTFMHTFEIQWVFTRICTFSYIFEGTQSENEK